MPKKMKVNTRVRQQIVDATIGLRQLMQQGLARAADGIVGQVIAKRKSLPDSKRFDAIRDNSWTGIQDYKASIINALGVIAKEALDQARKEVPTAKNVRLADFDKLPPDMQARLRRLSQLLSESQMQDLEKSVYFQFIHSVDSTSDIAMLEADLMGAAEEYISGSALASGSGIIAAQTINIMRDLFFSDDNVSKEIGAYLFYNPAPETEICTELAGTVFPADQPDWERYQPPLHWNCKSTIIPILNDNVDQALSANDQEGTEDLGANKSKAWFDKRIQFSEHLCNSKKDT